MFYGRLGRIKLGFEGDQTMLQIRRAKDGDWPAISEILERLDLAHSSLSIENFHVAESAGRIVGFAHLESFGPSLYLSAVGVVENLRKKGIGRQLVDGVLAGQDKNTYIYTYVPEFFSRLEFRPSKPPPEIPGRGIYDCSKCSGKKDCVCMMRQKRMRPVFPEFKSLEFEDAAIVNEYLKRSPRSMCEYSLANIMIWKNFDSPSYTFINDSLCLRMEPPNEPAYFFEPLGSSGPMDIVKTCLAHTGKMSRISSSFVSKISVSGIKIKPLRDQFDYIYRTRELAELKGRKFDGKRNHIRRMKRACPQYEYVKLKKEDSGTALKLFDGWFAAKVADRSIDELLFDCQRGILKRSFELFEELDLFGGMLKADGECLGFVIGNKLRDRMACVHFSYARTDIPGSYQALLWEACRDTFSGYEFVNLEQDLGVSGIRKVKESYYPLRFEEKFEIIGS